MAVKKKVAKKAVPKPAVKVAALKITKKIAAPPKAKSPRKPNPVFMKALTPSAILAEIVGKNVLPEPKLFLKFGNILISSIFKIQIIEETY